MDTLSIWWQTIIPQTGNAFRFSDTLVRRIGEEETQLMELFYFCCMTYTPSKVITKQLGDREMSAFETVTRGQQRPREVVWHLPYSSLWSRQHCTKNYSDLPSMLPLSLEENASLFFICRYVARHTGISTDCKLTPFPQAVSEFNTLVSRGHLVVPPLQLFIFSQMSYHLFRQHSTLTSATCATKIFRLFSILHSSLPFQVSHSENVFRRLVNTFFTGLVRENFAN